MSAPRFLGISRNTALFEARGKAVIVNIKSLTASIETGEVASAALSSTRWTLPLHKPDPVWSEIAVAALRKERTPTDISLSESTKRTYTVPKRVSECASSALKLGGEVSPVAKHIAALLSSGNQVSCHDVLWVSRFFENNAEPNVSRPVWMSWGGEEGKRWAESLASRLDYDSVIADAGSFETPGVQDFVEDDSSRTFWAKLTDPLSQYAHSLFKLTEAGTWQAWGNGDWIDCEQPVVNETFVELDEDAALYIAGALFDAPDLPVDLRTPNPEAWDLAAAARDEIDWTLVDRAMISAGEASSMQLNKEFTDNVVAEYAGSSIATDALPANPVEEGYTPEERAANASGQLRDANGRFADVGAEGAIKSSGIGGIITIADAATGQVTVQGADGTLYTVPSSDFEVGAAPHPKVDPSQVDQSKLDFTGIIAPTKQPPSPKAKLATDSQVLSPVKINEALENYSEYITEQRQEKSKDFKKLLDTPEEIEEVEPVVADGSLANDTPESDVPEPSADPTPDESDVEPVYMAIVANDDPRAVMDLVSLVPSTATSSEPKTFRRSGGKWVEDPDILRDIRSATPPALIQLDAEQFADVLAQVDMEGTNPPEEEIPSSGEQTITAAGGLDKNKGNAEELQRYWTVGEGGVKIRWKSGGDWTRCVRLLSKYLGPRAKGYCALRHHEMTGMWPGDRNNRENSGTTITAGAVKIDAESTDFIKRLPAVLRASADAAAVESARMRVRGLGEFSPIPPTVDDIDEGRSGRAFRIPLMIPEGLATGDGRIFGKGALGIRTLPIPLLWQIQTGEGHDGSVLVGKIERVERVPNGLGNAYGVFDTGPYGKEAQRLVESGMLRWVSADLDKFEVDEGRSDPEAGKMFISKGRAMGATLVPKPAFQECTIELIPLEENVMPEAAPSGIVASASIADAIPVEPPTTWFERPILNGPTPIMVNDNGQVFGHIATWHQDHIGYQNTTRAPRSASGYAYFHTGVLRTNEGKDVKVGQLTLAGGHAPMDYNAQLAAKHYDDTASAIADVHAGEDSYGIWVAGALRPGTTPEQIRALRASAPSGDWRAINNRLELVAVCQVNVPGFPVPRSLAASGVTGTMTALVAAGTSELLAMRIEQTEEERKALAASARMRLYKVLDVDGYLTEFKDFPAEKREALAAEGKALPDGSFPVENASDLRRALHAYEKAPEAKQASVRRHLVKSARALGKIETIPNDWAEASMSDTALSHRDRYESLVASARVEKVNRLRERVNPPTIEELAAKAAEIRSRVKN